MEVREIVNNYLKENGFDGLVNDELECYCNIEEMYECECVSYNCKVEYLHIQKDN